MKAKDLLLALAVPAAFAACSQEEFENDVQKVNDGRPVVGSIVLDIPEEAQTRWGWGSATGFTFDANDYIGAALMDKVRDLTAEEWADKYTIVNYISTNYKYGYQDGWTNNDAVMSEGNYFFYMPFNEKLKSRAGLAFNIPTDQFAYDETATSPVKDETRSWKKNQMFIGYDDIKEDDQAAKPQMVELFAKPRFNVNYIGSNGVEVERIVLRDATDKFGVKGNLTPSNALGAAYNPVAPAVAKYAVATDKNLAQAFAMYNKAVAEYTLPEGASFVNPLTVATGALTVADEDKVSDISLNFAPAAEVSGLMVVPAGTHNIANIKFDIYTNKGMVTLTPAIDSREEISGTDNELTWKNVAKLTAIVAGQGKKADAVTINFGDKDVKVPDAVTVSTTAQLESIMRWYKDASVITGALVTNGLTVTLVGDKVELTKKVYDIIKGNEALTVKFEEGTLTIASDLASDAIMLVAPASTSTVVVKNAQALAYTSALTTISYNINIAAEGELTVTANAASNKKTTLANVENKGSLKFNSGVVVVANAKKISNYKNMTVAANAQVTAAVENLADYNEKTKQYTQNADIVNNGRLTLIGESKNQSLVHNNSKLTVAGTSFTNDYTRAIYRGTNGYTGKIYNANATTSYIYSQSALINKGYIDNVGAIYSQNAGSIENQNLIDAKDGATTYITDNVNGEVRLEKRDTETQVNGEDKGKISYTMTANDLKNGVFAFDAASDKFNTLNVSMNVTFEDGKTAPENLVLGGNGNLTVNCKTWVNPDDANDTSVAAFKSITAKDGNRYILKGEKVTTKKLFIYGNTVFQIPALSSFGVFADVKPNSVAEASAIVTINGELLVGGKFNANFQGFQPSGTKSSAGDGSYNWNSTEAWGNDAEVTTLATELSAGTLKVTQDKTISSVTGAATLIGDGIVTVPASLNNNLSLNKVTLKSSSVILVLGNGSTAWADSEVMTVTNWVEDAVKNAQVTVYYTTSEGTYKKTFVKFASGWAYSRPVAIE